MNKKIDSAHRTTSWRSRTAGIATALVFLIATPATAQLTNIGAGAFSGSATILTFEDLPGDNSPLPAGYGSGSGVSFSAGTSSQLYSNYGGTLATAATTAGLGNVAANWGCIGTCGTGFSLATDQLRIGAYLSSNVNISVQVDAYRNGALLGSQTLNIPANQIAFVGFQDPAGIDQIVIGNNTDCDSCIHQLDNVMFDALAAVAAVAPIPTMSQWGLILLSGFLALGSLVALRRRHR